MARAYRPQGLGVYRVPTSTGGVNRPNRTAAGMTVTAERQAARIGPPPVMAGDKLTLSVRGTLDPLAAYRFDVIRRPCPGCGGPGKLALKPGRVKVRLKQIKLSRPKKRIP